MDLTRLFSFFLGTPVYRTKTVLYTSPAASGSQGLGEVELYDQAQSVENNGVRRRHGIPLPLILVQGIAQQVIDNWFRTSEEMEHVHQLIVETLPPNDSEVVTTFLRLTQALEVFSRRFDHKTYVTQEEYQAYYKAMVDAFPTEMPDALKDRLRNYLKFGNEYSLKSAIERLVESLKEPARGALNIENPEKFALLTVNTRNWLTHYGERRNPVVSGAREYYEINQKLRALLFGVLAHSLGFETPAIQHCIQSVR